MRLPRVRVHVENHVHDEIVVDFDLDAVEWADYDAGLMLLKELVQTTDVFKDQVIGRPYDMNRLVAAAQDAFIPLVESGDLWWENGYACVDVDTVKSMTCIRELAKEP